MAELEAEAYRLAGRTFNLGSPKQLGEILFDEQGLDSARKTRTGSHGTAADILEGLAAQGHPLPRAVLDWRQLQKLTGTYTDALIQEIAPDGRVHTSYAMAATSTGRLSSNDPNLQNIPIRTEEGRRIRRAFIAEDGHLLLSADYSQIELRVLAHMAGIAALKEAFARDVDVHAVTASQMFGVPIEGMDPLLRRNAKMINYGIIYGIGAFGLAQRLGIEFDVARRYIEAYFEQYPGIRDYMERAKAEARTHGYVTTLFGRLCATPEINSGNPSRRGYAERAAINAPIQGSAADIMKRAMIRADRALSQSNLGARMLLQVHDELVFEVPEDEVEPTADLIRDVMARAAHLDVPLVVDVGCRPQLGRRALTGLDAIPGRCSAIAERRGRPAALRPGSWLHARLRRSCRSRRREALESPAHASPQPCPGGQGAACDVKPSIADSSRRPTRSAAAGVVTRDVVEDLQKIGLRRIGPADLSSGAVASLKFSNDSVMIDEVTFLGGPDPFFDRLDECLSDWT